MLKASRRTFVLIWLFVLPNLGWADVPQPAGYRMELYDDLVPAALDGANTITAAELKEFQSNTEIVVVDVIPEHRRPDVLPKNQLWIPVPHKGVPGALWLPDTGFGSLSEVTENYFQAHLTRASGGNKAMPLVFYCRANCWMSWNAAKRALGYGYSNVYWFFDGVDDWSFEGYEFAVLEPAPGKRQAE